MPCLKVFKRHWNIGSDDVIIPAAIQSIASFAWISTYSCTFYRIRPLMLCAGGGVIHNLFAGGFLLQGANLVVLLSMMRVSLKGTLINWWPRRNIGHLIICKALLDVVGLFCTGVATRIAFFGEFPGCERPIVDLLKSSVKTSYGSLAAGFLALFLILQPRKPLPTHPDLVTSDSALSATAKTWANGFHKICRFLGLEDHPVLKELSNMVSIMFKEEVDIVPSDIIVSLVLLECEQNHRQAFVEKKSLKSQNSLEICPESWMTPELACHYMRFAAGSYGWPMYIFREPIATLGLVRVMARSRYIPRGLPKNIVEDNSVLANTTVIKMVTQLTNEDLVHVTFHNKLFEIPFYVALDHAEKSVVVSIRGTLSLEDVLTDLVAFESDHMPIKSIKDASAHTGMMHTAMYILHRLVGREHAKEILEECNSDLKDYEDFPFKDEKPLLEQAYDTLTLIYGEQKAKEFEVVVVGHSLGAGVAAVLTILLKESSRYQDVRCFAYSPPGGLMNNTAAEYSQQFVCSVVLGDDVVSHLGLQNLLELKQRIFQIIRDCDIPKATVMNNWLRRAINGMIGFKQPLMLDKGGSSWENDKDAERSVEKFQIKMQAAIDSTVKERQKLAHLFLPGVVMYLHESTTKSWFKTTRSYNVHFVSGKSEIFGEIFLSSEMIRHHTPWAVLDALTAISQRPKSS